MTLTDKEIAETLSSAAWHAAKESASHVATLQLLRQRAEQHRELSENLTKALNDGTATPAMRDSAMELAAFYQSVGNVMCRATEALKPVAEGKDIAAMGTVGRG